MNPDQIAVFLNCKRTNRSLWFDVGGDCALRGRQVDALTPNIELPTVLHATKPTFLIATEEEIGPTVRALRFYNTNGSVRIAEGDEVFAQQTQTLR